MLNQKQSNWRPAILWYFQVPKVNVVTSTQNRAGACSFPSICRARQNLLVVFCTAVFTFFLISYSISSGSEVFEEVNQGSIIQTLRPSQVHCDAAQVKMSQSYLTKVERDRCKQMSSQPLSWHYAMNVGTIQYYTSCTPTIWGRISLKPSFFNLCLKITKIN